MQSFYILFFLSSKLPGFGGNTGASESCSGLPPESNTWLESGLETEVDSSPSLSPVQGQPPIQNTVNEQVKQIMNVTEDDNWSNYGNISFDRKV